MNINELFKSFLEEIQPKVSLNVYNLWFATLKPFSLDENNLVIEVPMEIHRTILSTTYKDLIEQTFYSINNTNYNITYLTKEEIEEEQEKKSTVIDVSQYLDDEWESNLNPDFTFDTFVVGDSNKFAVMNAHMVAENPGNGQNPFFLYGKSGIGKTHLMHAIGNYISSTSKKKVLYVTSYEFRDDYTGIASVNKGKDSMEYANSFKRKYQNVDVLMIDDIQILVDSVKSQQEFFNIFNHLYNANKQIIISSDKSPEELNKFEDRLRSRFMMGLYVDIFPPDFELKCKIIQKNIKNTILENKLNQEIIEYIANSCKNDVRQIIGTINRLMAYTAMMGQNKIDLNFAMEALNDFVKVNIYSENSISKIQNIVADYFNISVSDLKSKKKTANIARPRHIAMYLCRIDTEEGLARIGLEFGGRDHSTVSSALDKITNELKTDTKLNLIIKDIESKL